MPDPLPLDASRVVTLREVFTGSVDLARGWSVYLPVDQTEVTDSTSCLLVHDLWDDVEADAAALGWPPGLSGPSIRGSIDDAHQQRDSSSLDDLVLACRHYYHHDAFIDFSAEPRWRARDVPSRSRALRWRTQRR